MDVVANYAAGEEVVGAFFSHESDKGKAPMDDDEGLAKDPRRKTTRTRRCSRTSARPSTTISSPRSSARSFEAPRGGCLREDAP